jgi:DNA-binding beta-propeller fold protein YncE
MAKLNLRFPAAALAVLGALATCRADGPYRFLKEIPIGGAGGWDYLRIDGDARRLYVSHATRVVVIDLDRGAVCGEVDDTPGVHGIAIAPELGRGFTSNGREGKAGIFDLRTLQTLSKVQTGENPDAIAYVPGIREVYTFNGRSRTATVFGAGTGRVLATIPLPGKPEFAAVDPKAGRIYDNIEDRNEVAVIDAGTRRIAALWPIAPGEGASGMAIDLEHHRLFIGCHNRLMAVLDSADGRVVATLPIDAGVDANAFDPGTQLAFSSNGAGTVTVVHEDAPDRFTVVQSLATMRGARTMALDPVTHAIYLADAKFEPLPEPQPGGPRPWPKIIPGTFKILVYGYAPASGP